MRHRSWFSGTAVNMSRLMHQRKAAKVLPVPVGARIKVESLRAIAGQPCTCGLVGAAKTTSNPSRTRGGNRTASRAAGRVAEGGYEGLLGSDIQGLYLDAGRIEFVGDLH